MESEKRAASRQIVYHHHDLFLFVVLLLVLVAAVIWLFVGAVTVAFGEVGFSNTTTIMILVATFLGSYINIPLMRLRAKVPIVKDGYVRFLGIVYRVPKVEYGVASTLLAVNVGGALIPTGISVYLLYRMPTTILVALVGIAVVAFVTHLVARPVKGVGITTLPFVPPIAAAVAALLLPSQAPRIVAYVAGVLGTLIGADLTNLHVIPRLGAPVASIGGAGTFDGIFLSGIIAVILA